jgi:hypothetical protein
MHRQIWIGSTDLAMMLRSIGGWHLGCYEERANISAVLHALKHGWLQKRIHYAEAWPEGSECWELTDAGLEYLGTITSRETAGGADKMRNWYRSHKKKWLKEHPETV